MKRLSIQEEYVLLSVYQLQTNAYLITIQEHLKEKTGKDYAIGTIYVPLDRLWKMGYLETRIGKPSPRVGGRAIKYYGITAKGVQVLAANKKIHDTMWLGFEETSFSD